MTERLNSNKVERASTVLEADQTGHHLPAVFSVLLLFMSFQSGETPGRALENLSPCTRPARSALAPALALWRPGASLRASLVGTFSSSSSLSPPQAVYKTADVACKCHGGLGVLQPQDLLAAAGRVPQGGGPAEGEVRQRGRHASPAAKLELVNRPLQAAPPLRTCARWTPARTTACATQHGLSWHAGRLVQQDVRGPGRLCAACCGRGYDQFKSCFGIERCHCRFHWCCFSPLQEVHEVAILSSSASSCGCQLRSSEPNGVHGI